MGGLGLLLINVSEVIRLEMAYTVALHQAKVKDIHLCEALFTLWICYTFLILC